MPAQCQTIVQAIAGGSAPITSYEYQSSCGGGPFIATGTGNTVTPLLYQGGFGGVTLPYVAIKAHDQWIPYTQVAPVNTTFGPGGVSEPPFIGSASVVFTQAGILTINQHVVQQAPRSTVVLDEKEVIDFNTGKDSYVFDETVSGDPSNNPPCPFYSFLEESGQATDVISFTPASQTPVSLKFSNPAVTASGALSFSQVDPNSVASAPGARAISADGVSAAALVFQSTSDSPVTLSLSGTSGSTSSVGLGPFTATYLSSPSPVTAQAPLDVQSPINPGCASGAASSNTDATPCTFLALLWAPKQMQTNGVFQHTNLITIQATQSSPGGSSTGNQSATATINLQPPPLVLVHGIWSSPRTWIAFLQWLNTNYPGQIVDAADYSLSSALTFETPSTQQDLARAIADSLSLAASSGVVASKVDVVAHSMGGLVTRYFEDNGPPTLYSTIPLPANPVHNLITIGTPQDGTPFASFAEKYQSAVTPATGNRLFVTLCAVTRTCTFGGLLANFGMKIDSGVASLEAGLPASSPSETYSSIVGHAPNGTPTGLLLNAAINVYVPFNSIDGILMTPDNDLIVPGVDQNVGAQETATVPDVVHLSFVNLALSYIGLSSAAETGETASQAAWQQSLFWLTGGGQAPQTNAQIRSGIAASQLSQATTAPMPTFDLTGYTQVAASNVSFTPVSGSSIPTGASVTITPFSAKTLTELLLFQSVDGPTDAALVYSTESPFTVSFTPSRLGTVSFTAFAVFNDNTFAAVPLTYTLQPPGTPLRLSLTAPIASLPVGMTIAVPVQADFSNGTADVSSAATYTARSGTKNVFSVGTNGQITTTGNGVDWLDVSYEGLMTSAQISVGSCTYALNPTNQIVQQSGGSARFLDRNS